jgi:Glycosyl transferase family 11
LLDEEVNGTDFDAMALVIEKKAIHVVIVGLTGGLGNQLFQYAFGRRLSIEYDVPVYLDITEFETYKLHEFSLKHYRLQSDFAPKNILAKTLKSYRKTRLGVARHWCSRWLYPSLFPKEINEPSLNFHSECIRAQPPVYLWGYWQDERYFLPIADIIRNDLVIDAEPESRDKDTAALMTEVESVSLHVRRADYVTNQITTSVHGVCGLNYYEEAIADMERTLKSPHFFVFSDDPKWCKEHVSSCSPMTFVDHNTAASNYQDLRLMSTCKHHIIANSSFSWWGAWLNRNQQKIVIAPRKWYASKDLEMISPALQSWRLI